MRILFENIAYRLSIIICFFTLSQKSTVKHSTLFTIYIQIYRKKDIKFFGATFITRKVA